MLTRGGEVLHFRQRARFPNISAIIVRSWLDLIDLRGKPQHYEFQAVLTGSAGTISDTKTTAGDPKPVVVAGEIQDAGVDVVRFFDTPDEGSTGIADWQRGISPVQLLLDDLVLCQGYLWQGQHAIRLGDLEDLGPSGGCGNMRTITGTNPAANTEVLETVPADVLWRLHAFTVVMAQGATQTPTPNLVIDDGTTANRRGVFASQNQGASTTRTHIWQKGSEAPASAAFTITDTDILLINGTLPHELILREGDRIRTLTTGIGANSNYADPIFRVEEWMPF